MQVLLLDIDGVLVHRSGYFSERFSREYSIPLDKILPFFKKEFKACMKGEADLKVELAKVLPEWKWQDSVDSFLKYWFDGETDLQLDILDYTNSIRKLGIKVFLASDNERYRTEFLIKHFGFDKLYDGVFASFDIGADKSEPLYFKRVREAMPNVLPEDIVLVDDDPKNVAAAKEIGLKGLLYINLEDLKEKISDLH